MIRLFRFGGRSGSNVVRCSICFASENPSTSRSEDQDPKRNSVDHRQTFNPDNLKPRRNSDQNAELRETKNRIQKWKERSANGAKDFAERIDGRKLQNTIDYEERQYNEQADEVIKILATITPAVRPEIIEPQLKISQKDSELKKKVGLTQFRKVQYDEGEIANSDLSLPPSLNNPHPFNPEKCAPPIYSRSIAPYVNKMPVLQSLVDIGVNLFEIDTSTNCGKFLLRLDPEKDVKPKLQWLLSIGFEPSDIGDYITRNPFFLFQNLHDLQTRVNYLEVHKFKKEQICKIIKEFRYWINTDVKTMDARLGWVQKQFQLKGNEVRAVITREPRVIMFGLGPLKRIFDFLNKECLFTMTEVKRIFVEDPRVFMMDPRYVQNNFHFVSRVMRISNSVIVQTPFLLRCSIRRSQYEGQIDPVVESDQIEAPVSLSDLLHSSDAHFAKYAGRSYLSVYNKFLRSH